MMSTNGRKQQNANQERKLQLPKRKLIACLKSRPSSINATKRVKVAYDKALKDRECYLKKERARKEKSRKRLKEMAAIGDKSAVAKVKKIKDKKHTQYLKNKALAKRKEWNKNSRRAKVWKFIESEINLKSKPIDEPWVK